MIHSPKINFSSENYAGVQPEMMLALAKANTGSVPSYGNDYFTKDAIDIFKEQFGDENLAAYFVFNGTGANNFGIGSVTEKYHSIFCTDVSHLFVDESTAPETFIGCRIYPVNSADGKIVIEDLKNKIKRFGDVHHPQPKIISITQPTEHGTVYTLEELKTIKAICTENDMLLHVDGARFFNAAVYLNASLKQLTVDAGVDILTLGGTKIGMMFGEAVIFFSPKSSASFKFSLKRSMQLASKNRFIAAQFQRLFCDGLWQQLAAHTNWLAKQFEHEIADVPSVKVVYPVETNAVFLTMSLALHEKLQEFFSFYYWDDLKQIARVMFSFDNTVDDIRLFVEKLREFAG